MISTNHEPSPYARWRELKADEPRVRARDAASRFGCTEAQLVASAVGHGVTRLQADFTALMDAFADLGEVTTIVRNASAVHEVDGAWTAPEHSGGSAVVHGGAVDLRLFPMGWACAFAVAEAAGLAHRPSVQIFDKRGDAVMKVFLPQGADLALAAFAERFVAADQSPEETPETKPRPGDRPDEEIDVEGLRAAWRGMKDTHEFFGMLRRFGVGRVQAMRLVGGELASKLPADVTEKMLLSARDAELPIMTFVGSSGAINIHTEAPKRVVRTGKWLNILDPGFNLHLDTDAVASAFVVRKPTVDGVVTSVELFDEADQNIALFFGARKPGIPELPAWRDLVSQLEGRAS